MKSAPKHPEEAARIETLESLELLDSLPEEAFDELTTIAAAICQTPIALLSLVDRDRQWFKSRHGLSATETPRNLAFCSHAILQDGLFEVTDSTADPRFADNPLVVGAPNVRFYAGVPLKPTGSLPIGTICVIDHQPRKLTEAQAAALRALSQQVNRLIRIRREKRRALRLNDELKYYKTAIDGMTEGVLLVDREGAVLEHNQAATSLLGLSSEELAERRSTDPRWVVKRADGTPLLPEERASAIVLRTGKPVDGFLMQMERPDGSVRWLEVDARPIFDADNPKPAKVVAIFRDVTESRKAQAALVQTAKMSSLGRMAAGLSHEVNNPLSVVIGRAYGIRQKMMRESLDRDSVQSDLDKIEQASGRITKIISGLSTFAKSGENEPMSSVEIQALVTDTIDLFREKTRKLEIDLRLQLPTEKTMVRCRPFQIAQVLVNLILNAQYAAKEHSEKWIEISVKPAGNSLLVAVSDSGPRIRPEHAERLFEPFFTTKPPGSGVGLGLSQARGIVEGHSGEIRYAAERPHTSFEFKIPL